MFDPEAVSRADPISDILTIGLVSWLTAGAMMFAGFVLWGMILGRRSAARGEIGAVSGNPRRPR